MQNRKRLTVFKMAAAAMLEIQVHAIKWAITTCMILMKIGTRADKSMPSSKIIKAEA
jgi:hypothetical protein